MVAGLRHVGLLSIELDPGLLAVPLPPGYEDQLIVKKCLLVQSLIRFGVKEVTEVHRV